MLNLFNQFKSIRYLLGIFCIFTAMLFSGVANAQQSTSDQRIQFTHELEQQSLITKEQSSNIREYIAKNSTEVTTHAKAEYASVDSGSERLTSLLTLSNALYICGAIFLFLSFSSFFTKIMRGCWEFIIKIPLILYQLFFLAFTGVFAFAPQVIWPTQSFYLAIFGSLSFLAVISWIVMYNPMFKRFLIKLKELGLTGGVGASAVMAFYFGYFSHTYNSLFFAFFTFIFILSFGFCLIYKVMDKLITSADHFTYTSLLFLTYCVLATGAVWSAQGVSLQWLEQISGLVFKASLYLTPVVMAGVLSMHSTSLIRQFNVFTFLWFILAGACVYLYAVTPSLIIACSVFLILFMLWLFHWMVWFSFRVHFIIGSASIGLVLYGLGYFVQQYSHLVILSASV